MPRPPNVGEMPPPTRGMHTSDGLPGYYCTSTWNAPRVSNKNNDRQRNANKKDVAGDGSALVHIVQIVLHSQSDDGEERIDVTHVEGCAFPVGDSVRHILHVPWTSIRSGGRGGGGRRIVGRRRRQRHRRGRHRRRRSGGDDLRRDDVPRLELDVLVRGGARHVPLRLEFLREAYSVARARLRRSVPPLHAVAPGEVLEVRVHTADRGGYRDGVRGDIPDYGDDTREHRRGEDEEGGGKDTRARQEDEGVADEEEKGARRELLMFKFYGIHHPYLVGVPYSSFSIYWIPNVVAP